MNFHFRKAEKTDIEPVWNILQQAILRRKLDGSNQWQDGYPNPEIVSNDVDRGYGHVLTDNEKVIGYCAVLKNDEPEYLKIQGKWLTENDFLVVHRIAISDTYAGRGLAKVILSNIEDLALKQSIYSIKVDTNFDNIAMIKTFEKLGYIYCGEVFFRGSARRAYEKVLNR